MTSHARELNFSLLRGAISFWSGALLVCVIIGVHHACQKERLDHQNGLAEDDHDPE